MAKLHFEKETKVRGKAIDVATKIMIDDTVVGLIFAPNPPKKATHFPYYKIGFYIVGEGLQKWNDAFWSKWRGGWDSADSAIEFLEQWCKGDAKWLNERYDFAKFKTR